MTEQPMNSPNSIPDVQSSADTLKKALWIVLVLVPPLLGVIIWYFAGPRGS